MSKSGWFLIIFVICEIALLAQMISSFGFLYTLLWLLLMAVIGSRLIYTASQAMQGRGKRITPGTAITYFLGGFLLIIPGVLTDVLALLILLLPKFNQLAITSFSKRYGRSHSRFSEYFGSSEFFFSQTDFGSNDTTGATGSSESEGQDPNVYGQPTRNEQPKSQAQKARDQFKSKRTVIDADFESVPEDANKGSENANATTNASDTTSANDQLNDNSKN